MASSLDLDIEFLGAGPLVFTRSCKRPRSNERARRCPRSDCPAFGTLAGEAT
jgi:hypothetical protein